MLKWLFVDEKYRGQRLSQQLIEASCMYTKQTGFDQIFPTTWHENFYEKHGFVKIGEKEVRENYSESIYRKEL